jgi:hypothetical protein
MWQSAEMTRVMGHPRIVRAWLALPLSQTFV